MSSYASEVETMLVSLGFNQCKDLWDIIEDEQISISTLEDGNALILSQIVNGNI